MLTCREYRAVVIIGVLRYTRCRTTFYYVSHDLAWVKRSISSPLHMSWSTFSERHLLGPPVPHPWVSCLLMSIFPNVACPLPNYVRWMTNISLQLLSKARKMRLSCCLNYRQLRRMITDALKEFKKEDDCKFDWRYRSREMSPTCFHAVLEMKLLYQNSLGSNFHIRFPILPEFLSLPCPHFCTLSSLLYDSNRITNRRGEVAILECMYWLKNFHRYWIQIVQRR